MPESQSSPTRRRRRWPLIVAVLVAVSVAVLIGLPELARWGGQKALRDLGLSATIEDIDFNPFTGRLAVERLDAQHGPVPVLALARLDLELRWRSLFSRTLEITDLRLQGLELVAERNHEGEVRVAGIDLPTATEPAPAEPPGTDSPPWAMRLRELSLSRASLRLVLPEGRQELQIDELRVSDLDTADPAQALQFDFAGAINGAPLALAGSARPLAQPITASVEYRLEALRLDRYLPWLPLQRLAGVVAIDGQLQVEVGEQGQSIAQQGQVTLSGLQLARDDPGLIELDQGRVDTRLGLVLGGETLTLDLESVTVVAEGLRVALPEVETRLDRLRWHGQVDLVRAAEAGYRVDGELSLGGIRGDLVKPPHRFELGGLEWRGQLSQAGDSPLPSVQGALEMAELRLDDRILELRLLALDRLQAVGLRNDGQPAVQLDSLRLDGAELLNMQGAPRVLAVGSLQAGPIAADATAGAVVERIRIDALEVDLTRDEEGGLRVIDRLTAERPQPATPDAAAGASADASQVPATEVPESEGVGDIGPGEAVQSARVAPEPEPKPAQAGAEPPPAEAEAGDGPGPGLRIDRLEIGPKSWVQFNDLSVTPPFATRLDVDALELTGLDTRQTEQAVSFSLRARSGSHTELNTEGRLTALAEQPSGQISGTLTHFELQPLTSYTRDSLGYKLSSGLADAEFEVRLGEGRVDGTTRFDLVGLQLDPSDEDQMQALTKRLSMPLPSALDLLRKSDGHIELEVPVSGRLDDPQFDVSDAINQALGSAMKSGVFAYLKYALQPYGTLISLAQMAGDAASRVRLDPLTFDPGAESAGPDSDAYLERVAGLLAEKPEITLRICSYYTPADVRALTPPPPPPPSAPAPGSTPAPATASAPQPAAGTPSTPAAPPAVDPQKLALELAGRRAEWVKSRLVEAHGIAPRRLPLCLPEPDKQAEAVARVELLI